MKRTLIYAICAVFITACGGAEQDTQTAAPAVDDSQSAGPVLGSGFDVANMDQDIRPQDDFYRYVNGTWLDNTEIPADKSNYGSFNELIDESELAVKEIIEEAAAVSDAQPGSGSQMVGDYYNAYMDTDAVEARGLDPLNAEFDRIESIESIDDIVAYIGHSQIIAVPNPFAMFINQDSKDTTRYVPFMIQGGLGLPDRNYYLEDQHAEVRGKYQEYVAKMFDLAGLENGSEAGEMILALETRLAEVHWTRVETRDRNKRYNLLAVDTANELTPGFDWAIYLQATGIDTGTEFIVWQPSFMQGMATILSDTPIDDWQTYFSFKLLNGFAASLPDAFVEASFDFNNQTLQGIEEIRPRWKRAVEATNGAIGEITGKLYVDRHFDPASKTRMDEMVENLSRAFEIAIDELEWMSDETKAEAQDKLTSFTKKIGYPDAWRDYSALTIAGDDLIGNAMRASEFEHDRNNNKLGMPIDRGEWFMSPQMVNAYYNPPMNEIVFPAAILRPPFFNVDADDAVNYGAIGAVIGHEFSHGFDDQGSKSDGEGNLRNWWTDQDAEEFKARTSKLVAQFSAYSPLPDQHVNGELTLGENIGDLAGLTMAYKAYQLSLNGEEAPVIDGYTGDQRFFMGWAQVWRRKYREEEMTRRLNVDPHSPSEYRVIGPFSNMPEFYQAFEVQEGDAMYIAPEDPVKIW